MSAALPKGWGLVQFDEVASITNGQVDPKQAPYRDMLLIGPDHLLEGGGGLVGPLLTAAQQGAISGKYAFRAGQVIYSKIRPNLNKVYFAVRDGLCSADVYPIHFNARVVEPRFSYYVMLGEQFYKAAVAASMRSGIPKVNRDDLSTIEFLVPPLAEQRRIIAVLDAWDRAIDLTERLIIAKRRRKAALVQKLFSNLPRRGLLEAADIWFSGVNKKSIVGEDAIRLCNYMDVFHNARITPALDFMRATASGREIETNTLRRHDVVFTKDSEIAEELAECALVAEEIDNLVCGYHLAVARPREGQAYGPFLAQALRHPEIRWQFSRLANGVVRRFDLGRNRAGRNLPSRHIGSTPHCGSS